MILGKEFIGIRTPLRVSLFGGGTDFLSYIESSGFGNVLSFTINKYIYLFLKPRSDSKVRVAYSVNEEVEHAKDLEHDICRAVLLRTGLLNGFEIHSLADISSKGSGLGSSSAYTVSLLHAAYAYQESIRANPYTLANDACDIEIQDLGKPIGIQDQWATSIGNLNILRFTPGNVAVSRLLVPHPYVESICSLYYTGNTRSADTILKEQSTNIPVSKDSLDEIRDSVTIASKLLSLQDTKSLGKLLDETWKAKKKLASSISSSNIDEMHSVAMSNGALGAKICGAGGGGYLLCISQPKNKEKLSEVMQSAGYPELKFTLDKSGTKRIL